MHRYHSRGHCPVVEWRAQATRQKFGFQQNLAVASGSASADIAYNHSVKNEKRDNHSTEYSIHLILAMHILDAAR